MTIELWSTKCDKKAMVTTLHQWRAGGNRSRRNVGGMGKSIQVAICDCCPTIRCGLQYILGSAPDIKTVAEASSHEEMFNEFIHLDLDVILVDIGSNKQTGFNYIRKFRETRPDVKTIIFTGYSSDERAILEAIDIGVHGFQLKQANCNEINNAIHVVQKGCTSLAPVVITTLLEQMP